jgi:hypothetical protein
MRLSLGEGRTCLAVNAQYGTLFQISYGTFCLLGGLDNMYLPRKESFQQVVTGIHFNTDRIQSLNDFGYVRYNSILAVRQLG